MHPGEPVSLDHTDVRPIDRAVARQAAHWLMRLGAEDLSAAERLACAQWRAADAEHERAWQRALAVGRKFGAVPPELGLLTLARPSPKGDAARRRAVLKSVVLLVAGVPLGWHGMRSPQWQAWQADYRTATGETREWRLADGTRLVLDTASAADVRFDGEARQILLRAGAVWIETAADPQQPARPLAVITPQGRIRPVGTRFSVRLRGEHSDVVVQQGAVAVRPLHETAGGEVFVAAGQTMRFDAGMAGPPVVAPPHPAGWTRGVLHAEAMPLGDFIAELGRYRPGILRCAPEVAALPVSGAFQLADTDAVLAALAAHLPLRVTYRTRYWVSVGGV